MKTKLALTSLAAAAAGPALFAAASSGGRHRPLPRRPRRGDDRRVGDESDRDDHDRARLTVGSAGALREAFRVELRPSFWSAREELHRGLADEHRVLLHLQAEDVREHAG